MLSDGRVDTELLWLVDVDVLLWMRCYSQSVPPQPGCFLTCKLHALVKRGRVWSRLESFDKLHLPPPSSLFTIIHIIVQSSVRLSANRFHAQILWPHISHLILSPSYFPAWFWLPLSQNPSKWPSSVIPFPRVRGSCFVDITLQGWAHVSHNWLTSRKKAKDGWPEFILTMTCARWIW